MQLVFVFAVDKDVEWKICHRLQVYYERYLRNIVVASEVDVNQRERQPRLQTLSDGMHSRQVT